MRRSSTFSTQGATAFRKADPDPPGPAGTRSPDGRSGATGGPVRVALGRETHSYVSGATGGSLGTGDIADSGTQRRRWRHTKVQFFASRLKYSRMVRVTITPNQNAESLCRAFVEHLDDFGGVPLLAVFDRPKTVAIKWRGDGTVTQWNSTFLAVASELRVGIELCWPYSPEQKGSVDNLVGWVKKSFFKVRKFIDEECVLAGSPPPGFVAALPLSATVRWLRSRRTETAAAGASGSGLRWPAGSGD